MSRGCWKKTQERISVKKRGAHRPIIVLALNGHRAREDRNRGFGSPPFHSYFHGSFLAAFGRTHRAHRLLAKDVEVAARR